MEPDVIRLYSSSPPPLDDGAEEDDDDFGDFGAFSGVPTSVSFTEFDTQPVFGQSQAATAADTSPPNHFAELGPGPLGSGPSNSDPQGADLSAGHEGRAPAKTVSAEEWKNPLDQTQRSSAHLNSSEPEAGGGRTKVETHSCNGVGEVLTNGFVAFDGEDGPLCPSLDHPINKGTTAPTLDYPPPGTQDELHGFSAIDDRSEWVTDTRANGERSDEGKRLANGVSDGQSDPGEAEASGEENGVRDSRSTRPDTSDLPVVVMETLSNRDRGSLTDEHSEQRDTDSCTAHPDPAAVDQGGGPVIQNGTEEQEGQVETEGEEVGEEIEEEEVGKEIEEEEVGEEIKEEEVGEEVEEEIEEEEEVGEEVDEEIEEEGKVDGEVMEEQGEVQESDECEGEVVSTGCDDEGPGRGGKGMENELGLSVSESFASFCQAVSPEGEEDFGDFSTPSLAPSACPEEETLTPADPSWPTEEEEEEEEEDFGDFGNASSFSGPGFADFDRTESEQPAESAELAKDSGDDKGDFGDFSAPREGDEGKVSREGFADFPGSDSFADFSVAPAGTASPDSGSGWNAFEDQETDGGDSWAAFGEEESTAPSESQKRFEDSTPVTAPPSGSLQTCRRDSLSVALVSRLERLFRASFSDVPSAESEEEVFSLRVLLDPPKRPQEEGDEGDEDTLAPHEDLGRVWRQLLEIHDALGLRYQWGGSHSNKALLCSLGIDTRNILFTGQKKQPVIVPMYAASLGMLEPTKEPVKPISAAEKITSIAQAPPVSPEMSTCSPDPSQEALPPVQFDWSSSGLTNPLDASGGSCLLNLDFFGPVDDSSSSSTTSIPGVDPELYELTTAKMDTSNTSSRIADAFARLMSTMEKTSTSTRKPRKEENLSQEAVKVIAGLPDLSFMQAKVLMFPTTLTPLGCSAPTPD